MPAPTVVLSAVRTPWSRHLGSLSDISAVDLGARAAGEALRRAGIDAGRIRRVWFGNVLADSTGGNPAGAVCRAAGLPRDITAVTLRMGCASGLAAVAAAVEAIASGSARVALAGGFESSSGAPHLAHGLRRGLRLGSGKLRDSARHDGPAALDPSPEEEARRLQALQESGALEAQLMKVEVPRPRRGLPPVVERDELPAPGAPRPALADGAAALVLASASWAEKHGARPLARLELSGDPLAEATGCSAIHADLTGEAWEELGRRAKDCEMNPAGGGGALGHAAGADGARLAVALAHGPGRKIMALAADGHGAVIGVTGH